MLQGQEPVAQDPEPQAPEAQGGAEAGAGAVAAANDENCLAGDAAPHFGHFFAPSEAFSTSFSNAWPHFLHWYS